MTTVSSIRAALIGSDSLLVQCGEHLLSQGHTISHVVTDQSRIADWARSHSLAVLDANTDYLPELSAEAFDCLFSITWLSILQDEVLALPTKWAINFHDGPLPRYAGLYTPAWAIMERAPRYGVTWHAMTSGIDRGDILEQEYFDLAPDESSLTINTRCFEAGLASFQRLVSGITAGEVQRSAQDSTERTYFGKYKRPRAGCTLDWNRPVLELDALVRALDFGSYSNPLGTAKIFGPNEALSVTRAKPVSQSGAPGQIMSLDGDALVVGTREGALSMTEFAHPCGATLTVNELVRRWSLAAGMFLPILSTEQAEQLTQLNEKLVRTEPFWALRLKNLEPIELPWAEPRGPVATRERGEVTLELGQFEFFRSFGQSGILTAIGGYLARTTGKALFHVGLRYGSETAPLGYTALVVPFEFNLDLSQSITTAIEHSNEELQNLRRRGSWMRDLIGRDPELRNRPELERSSLLPIDIFLDAKTSSTEYASTADLTFILNEESRELRIQHDVAAYSTAAIERISNHLRTWFSSLACSQTPLSEAQLLPENELEQVLVGWNSTVRDYPGDRCIHTLFEECVRVHPNSIAAACGECEVSYASLDQRANQLAHQLIEQGVGVGDRVGLYLERSIELLIAVFGILKAGGAYVPLDPEFPADRIQFMLEDANARALVTESSLLPRIHAGDASIVCLDTDAEAIARRPETAPASTVTPYDLAYAIYTSGSTGTPKGVLIEHRNVANFFAGMDERIGEVKDGVWLAVTSLSFDISVLELLWTACRGFKTVLYQGLRKQSSSPQSAFDFGLSFFASNRKEDAATQYDFLLDSARFADQNGFNSIWTPERHFHAFGGLYPNPSVTSAALAAITKNIQLRSGSVVMALHHPIRIAEEWSLVDNLSRGRVGISIASGWHPNDFVLAPDCYENRKELMIENIRLVRKLWRGEAVDFPGPDGAPVSTSIMPKPVQSELPIWVTAAGNPETFRQAGELGANVLTHLLGQTTEELREKITVYRKAWKSAGHVGEGSISLMLHTFIGENLDEVREIVREPMRDYLRSAVDLIKNHVASWSAVKKSVDGGMAPEIGSLEDLPQEDLEALLDYSFERYFETSALFGTPESTLEMLATLHSMGIGEITCLVDFGVPCQQVLDSLPSLAKLRDLADERFGQPSDAPESVAELIARHGVTHMQCTPSMASLLIEDEATADSLSALEVMMIGGEAFPIELARRLEALIEGRLINMYGPTETTIWSSTKEITSELERMTIGTPIANTQFYVLDSSLNPMPIGASGELYIGGDGVTRGYHERPALTNEHFVVNPFRPSERMYRTGDLARWLPNGEVDYQGRLDHQVKIRGYRIELGEIEARLSEHDDVAQAVVVASNGPEPTRLVAFLIPNEDAELSGTPLAQHLASSLPDYMIPEEFRVIGSYPLTPNKKVDRKAITTLLSEQNAPTTRVATPVTTPTTSISSPISVDSDNEVMEALQTIWKDVLGLESCGLDENFFDLGGHSLLTIRVQKAIRDTLGVNVPLVDMFRYTTIRTLAQSLKPADEKKANDKEAPPSRAAQRAAKRRRRAS